MGKSRSEVIKGINKLSSYRFGFRIFPTGARWRYVFVTMGLPGTGKTSFCEVLANAVPACMCKLIQRDALRMDLLWDIRKLDPKKQQRALSDLDDLTTSRVIEEFDSAYDNEHLQTFIIDGCHTDQNTMFTLLRHIRDYTKDDPVFLSVCIIGSPSSKTAHQVTGQSEGDYSSFSPHGEHNSIPLSVLNKKRQQMKDFLNNNAAFEVMTFLCDQYYLVPSIDGKFIDVNPNIVK